MNGGDFKRIYRYQGYFEAGQIRDLENSVVNSYERSESRSGVDLFPSESADKGDNGLFQLGQGGAPAPCGYWPFAL